MKHPLFIAAVVGALACHGCNDTKPPTKFVERQERDLKGTVRTSLDHPNPTKDQLARRERSIATLKSLGVPFMATLPVTEEVSAIHPRSAAEVSNRCIAIAICAVRGETGDQSLTDELTEKFAARRLFSPREVTFIESPVPSQQELIDAAWGYEVVHVLLWSLGYLDRLQPPNHVCDVPSEMAIIRQQGRDLSNHAHPRTMDEIMEQADLYYHLHWSVIELRIRNTPSAALNEEIIQERHRALNWLIRYMGQDWDDVQTDT